MLPPLGFKAFFTSSACRPSGTSGKFLYHILSYCTLCNYYHLKSTYNQMMLHEPQSSPGVHDFGIEFDLINSPGVTAELQFFGYDLFGLRAEGS